MPGASWFPGTSSTTPSTRSAAAATTPLAMIAGGEDRDDVSWTWGELRALTARIAAGLRALGVSAATASPPTCRTSPRPRRRSWPARRWARSGRRCSPDFGARSVIDRFEQIEPKVLLAVRGYRYNGREFDRTEALDAIVASMPGLGGDRRAG